GNRDTNGAYLHRVRRIDRNHWAGLGRAVAFGDLAAGNLVPAFGDRLLQRHAAGQRQFQAAEVQLTELLVVAQRGEQGIEADESREALTGHVLDRRRNVTRVGDQDIVATKHH